MFKVLNEPRTVLLSDIGYYCFHTREITALTIISKSPDILHAYLTEVLQRFPLAFGAARTTYNADEAAGANLRAQLALPTAT